MDKVEMDRVVVTRPFMGIIGMQVCAVKDATDEEILEVCNEQNPAGTSLGWSEVIREGNTDHPEAVPVPCKDDSERTHFIVTC